MNYGLTQLGKGDYNRALENFERAEVLAPDYPALEVNLGIANAALNREDAAAGHFARAIQLAPEQTITHFYYGRWLQQRRRGAEAMVELRKAMALNPDFLDARYLLMDISAQSGDWATVRTVAASTLGRFPADRSALTYLQRAESGKAGVPEAITAAGYLNLSLSHYGAGEFPESIAAAREALKLDPQFAEAYNNIAASYQSMGQWDQAIAAARTALKIRPDFPLARNNLAWSEDQKRKTMASAKR
jgi:tetratricopeptide (TPR) repeat protein